MEGMVWGWCGGDGVGGMVWRMVWRGWYGGMVWGWCGGDGVEGMVKRGWCGGGVGGGVEGMVWRIVWMWCVCVCVCVCVGCCVCVCVYVWRVLCVCVCGGVVWSVVMCAMLFICRSKNVLGTSETLSKEEMSSKHGFLGDTTPTDAHLRYMPSLDTPPLDTPLRSESTTSTPPSGPKCYRKGQQISSDRQTQEFM